MLLYEVPRNTWVKIEDIEEPILYHHADGAYSYCTLVNGDIIHINAWTEVEIINREEN